MNFGTLKLTSNKSLFENIYSGVNYDHGFNKMMMMITIMVMIKILRF